MTLNVKEILENLERFDKAETVHFDFGFNCPDGVFSSRGDYSELAIGYTEGYDLTTVGQLIRQLQDALDKKHTGYKGGEYEMTLETPVWVEKDKGTGSIGTGIKAITNEVGIIIHTQYEDI